MLKNLKNPGQVVRGIQGANSGMVSSTYGFSLVSSGSPNTTPLAKRINNLERQMLDGKLLLVNDDGKLLNKVDYDPVNADNDNDVEMAYDETTQFMTSRCANDARLKSTMRQRLSKTSSSGGDTTEAAGKTEVRLPERQRKEQTDTHTRRLRLKDQHQRFSCFTFNQTPTILLLEMDNLLSSEGDSQRTQYPYVTGTSVIGIKYKDGILMAADMGGSYGSTIRYKSIERLKQVGKYTLLGASGEISDYQEIQKYLDELILHDNMWDDGNSLGPKEVHNYLTRVMYNRRNKFDPLWNSLILGGVKNGQKYLGSVSMIGVHFEDDHVATGFGNHLARPILREEWRDDLTFEEGVKLLEKCMRNLLYRDRSAVNKVQIAKITEEGMTISQPYSLKTYWDFAAFKNPTVGAEGSW
nr:proteasome subunit beta type-4 [Tanacetum cinerariifolium]